MKNPKRGRRKPLVKKGAGQEGNAPGGRGKKGLLVVAGAVVFCLVMAGAPLALFGTGVLGSEVRVAPAELESGFSASKGTVDAPVVVHEFGDFMCPFCARYALEEYPAGLGRLVESGRVRFVWKDYPALGDASRLLAAGGRCAGKQGLFWEYHDAVFGAVSASTGAVTREWLSGVAQGAGLEGGGFGGCLETFDLGALDEALESASGWGIYGTPTFLVDGLVVPPERGAGAVVDAVKMSLADLGQ